MARALFKSWFVAFDPVHAKAALKQRHAANFLSRREVIGASNVLVLISTGWTPAIAALFPDSFVDSELGSDPGRVGRLRLLGDHVVNFVVETHSGISG